jgi:hypothetical protein
VLLSLVLVLMSARAWPDSASVPYASLYQALAPGLQLVKYPRLAAVQRITSKNGDVAPSLIRVWINAPDGRIDVPVAADGQVSFPMQSELNSSAATVSSNQPRGSLSVSLSFEVVPPRVTVWPWSEFAATVNEARIALNTLEGEHRGAQIMGLEFRMPTAQDSLTVETATGEDLLLANPKGQIVLRWDDRIAAQSTRIRFSQPPLQALPYLKTTRTER